MQRGWNPFLNVSSTGEWDISVDSSSCDLNPENEIQCMEERGSIIPGGSKAHCKNVFGFRADATLEIAGHKMQIEVSISMWTGTYSSTPQLHQGLKYCYK